MLVRETPRVDLILRFFVLLALVMVIWRSLPFQWVHGRTPSLNEMRLTRSS